MSNGPIRYLDVSIVIEALVPGGQWHTKARHFFDSSLRTHSLCVPFCFWHHLWCGLYSLSRQNVLNHSQAKAIVKGLPNLLKTTTDIRYVEQAWHIAESTGAAHIAPLFYVAVAEHHLCELWTASEMFPRRACVKFIGDYAVPGTR
jgi:predicted nucleic acid-binding protein